MKNMYNKNNASPIQLPIFGPKDSHYHPSVLYFKDGWGGYKYWMAETPYPSHARPYKDRWECPCIHASVDGVHWVDPEGLINPLADLTEGQIKQLDFYSDPHLFMRGDTMECWYRISQRHGNTSYANSCDEQLLLRRTSKDGVHWSEQEILLDLTATFQPGELVSPAVIFENGLYKMWMVRLVKKEEMDLLSLVFLTSSDAYTWSNLIECKLEGLGYRPWHIDVRYFDEKYHLVVNSSDKVDSLFLLQSTDGLNFGSVKRFPITTEFGSFYSRLFYRSSICKVSDDEYRLYFSAFDEFSTHIGLLQGNSIEDMKIVSGANKAYRDFIGYIKVVAIYILSKIKWFIVKHI